MDRNLNIFFDLDETLIQSVYYGQGFHHFNNIAKVRERGLETCETGKYLVILRSITRDMLAYARMRGNVFILTQGAEEYCLEINNKHKLGFNYLTCYCHEDIYYAENKPFPIFKDKKNVLIDNLTFTEQLNFPFTHKGHRSKIGFLDDLKESHYYNIPEFAWGLTEEEEQETLFNVQGWIDKFIE